MHLYISQPSKFSNYIVTVKKSHLKRELSSCRLYLPYPYPSSITIEGIVVFVNGINNGRRREREVGDIVRQGGGRFCVWFLFRVEGDFAFGSYSELLNLKD